MAHQPFANRWITARHKALTPDLVAFVGTWTVLASFDDSCAPDGQDRFAESAKPVAA
jgi:hypothetical protein